ncbi:Hypothetical predicted protein [Pelobates cultripes]|uniref:Uncharacterized protein n=1 Tax=Pelobates cultripes TaxID=61616 RepID=A0AAD1TIW9_PELCU|nr:Hypothetical predicted protein [Pelobates cultripes]
MPLDGWYRIPKPNTGTQGTSRDTIVRFQQSRERLAFMAAIRNRSPYQFEEHSLPFFPNLSRATLEWRRSPCPLTKELLAHTIPYRWGTPRSLIIQKDNGDLKVTTTDEIPDAIRALGLSTQVATELTQPPPSTSACWDPAKVRPIVPAAQRGDPLAALGS